MRIANLDKLQEIYEATKEKPELKEGDFVTWAHPILKSHFVYPGLGEAALVRRVLEAPVFRPDNRMFPYVDVVVGAIDKDGDYLEFSLPSNILQKINAG